jgi:hypothetical protein
MASGNISDFFSWQNTFLKMEKNRHKFPVFKKISLPRTDRKKAVVLGRVSPHLCLLATVLRVL